MVMGPAGLEPYRLRAELAPLDLEPVCLGQKTCLELVLRVPLVAPLEILFEVEVL
jgi:hypothetical protein